MPGRQPGVTALRNQLHATYERVAQPGPARDDNRLHDVMTGVVQPTDQEKLENAAHAIHMILGNETLYQALDQSLKNAIGNTYADFQDHARDTQSETGINQRFLVGFQNEFFEEAKRQYQQWFANEEERLRSGAPHGGPNRPRPTPGAGRQGQLDKNQLIAIDPKTNRLAYLDIKNHTYRDITDREIITTDKAGHKEDQVRDILHQFAWLRQQKHEEFFNDDGTTPSIRIGFDKIHSFDGRAKYHESMRRGLVYALQNCLPVDLSFDPNESKFDPSDQVERYIKNAKEKMEKAMVKLAPSIHSRKTEKACEDVLLIVFTKRFEAEMHEWSKTNPNEIPTPDRRDALHDIVRNRILNDIENGRHEFARGGDFSIDDMADKAISHHADLDHDDVVGRIKGSLTMAANAYYNKVTYCNDSQLHQQQDGLFHTSVSPAAIIPTAVDPTQARRAATPTPHD